jgi:hypothetical protein
MRQKTNLKVSTVLSSIPAYPDTSEIWGAVDIAVLNKVLKKSKNLLKKKNDKLFACPGKNFQHKN